MEYMWLDNGWNYDGSHTDNGWNYSGSHTDGGWNYSGSHIDNGWNYSGSHTDGGWNYSSDWNYNNWSDWSDSWSDWSDWDNSWSDWSDRSWSNSSWSNSSWSNTSTYSSVDWEKVHDVGNVIGIIVCLLLLISNLFFISYNCFATKNMVDFFKLIVGSVRLGIALLFFWIRPIRKLFFSSLLQIGLFVWTIFDIISLF